MKNIQVEKISKEYLVRRLDKSDIDMVFELNKKNKIYYQYCPPMVTRELVIEDMEVPPKGKTREDKYFLGYFENDKLIAILDLIDGYPNENTAYIGLFMMDVEVQGKGVGTKIIEELCDSLSEAGFQRVELAFVNENPQAKGFWLKNKFEPIEERKGTVSVPVMAAERYLK